MKSVLTVYHGSKNGLEGPVRKNCWRVKDAFSWGGAVSAAQVESIGLRSGADVRLALLLEENEHSFFNSSSSSRKSPSRSRRRKPIAINWILLCDVQGKLFELAWRKGFDMSVFVPTFMKSRTATLIDSTYSHLQWAGEAYILEEFVAETGLRRGRARKSLPPEHLFWSGYLYRYWHCLTGETSAEIHATAPYRTMAGMYAGYHTLSCELAIENLREDSKAA